MLRPQAKAVRAAGRKSDYVRRLPIRVNIRWRSGDRAGRARLSETAGSPANHRPVRPNAFASRNGSRPNSVQLRPRFGGLGETHPLPQPSPDCYQNHAHLQPRTPSYVDLVEMMVGRPMRMGGCRIAAKPWVQLASSTTKGAPQLAMAASARAISLAHRFSIGGTESSELAES